MARFLTPELQDFEYNNPEDFGYFNKEDLPDLDHVKLMITNLISSVYVTGDLEVLQDSLDELGSAFDVELPVTCPVIDKKMSIENRLDEQERSKQQLLDWLKSYSHEVMAI